MTLPEQLRAIADRLATAEAAVLATKRELWLLALDLPGDVVDAIEQPALGSAGAVAAGEVDAFPTSSAAPIEEPGQAREDGARVPAGRRARATVAPPSEPSSTRQGTPAPATDAGAVRDGRRATSSEGAGSTPAPRSTPLAACPECGKEVKASGLGTHRRILHGYRASNGGEAAATCPECGLVIRFRSNLPRHQRLKHGVAAAVDGPATNGAGPVMRKGIETYLCDRCPWTFLSREARDAHRATHAPEPRGQPLGRRPSLVPGGGALDDG